MTETFRIPSRVGLVATLFALGACGTTTGGGGSDSLDVPTGTKPYRPYMVGKPYTISGKRYYPKENLSYDRVGVASWYGKDFHGRRTANGETYDMNAMTAAHPTLPMPSIVRVKNLKNGRTVLLRVNDRGPFASDRIIDVSRRAARELGFIRAGTARVRVTILRDRTIALKRKAGYTTVARVSTPMKGPDPMDPTHRDQFKNGTPKDEDTPTKTVSVANNKSAYDEVVPRHPLKGATETTDTSRTAGSTGTGAPAPTAPANRRDDLASGPNRGGGNGPVDIRPRDLRAEKRTPAPRVVAAPTTRATVRRIYIEAGAYTERDRAFKERRKLSSVGKASVSMVNIRDTSFYRVWVGPVKTAEAGDRLLARMVGMGYTGARIVVD